MSRHRNLLPKLCLSSLIAIAVAAIFAVAASQLLVWNAPGDILFDQGVVQSIALGIVPAAAVFTNLIVASYRSAENRDWLWLAGSLLIWPLSFWYTLIETNDER